MPNTILTQQAILFLTTYCYKKIEKYNNSLNGFIFDSNKKTLEIAKKKIIEFRKEMVDYFNNKGEIPKDETLIMDFYYYMYDIISEQRLKKNTRTDVEGLQWVINKMKNQQNNYA